MHEYRRVNADYIVMKHGHRFPPVTLDVVLQFHAVLSVVVNGRQTVINLRRLEYESVLLGMRYYRLEYVLLFCHYDVSF